MAYQGTKAKLPLGEYGLLTDIAPDKMPSNALIKAENVCYTNGSVQKAPGSRPWNETPLGNPIVALYDWHPDTVKQRMIVVTANGFAYKGQDRQFNTTLADDLGVLTPNCQFAEGGAETAGRAKKLFLITWGKTLPQVLTGDGTSFVPISTPATDWTSENYPKCGVIHRNRFWVFAGQISYASDSGDHELFTGGTVLVDPVYSGEGGDIRGAYVFKGRLFCFKDGGFTYLLNDTDFDTENWFWEKISSNFGLAAPNAIGEVLDNLHAGNTTGTITDYAATQKLGNVEAGDLIQNCMFEAHLRGNTSKVGVPEQHVLYYAEKKQLFATYRSAYYQQNNMLIMFDFARVGQVRPAYWIKGTPMCLAIFKDVNQIDRPMYGDGDGYVQLMDSEDRLEGATAYSGEFQIPHLDFSYVDPKLSSAEKHFDFIAVHYMPESKGNLLCDYYVDGKYMDTVSFTMIQNKKPKLNKLLLSTDRLAQANSETCIRKVAGTGRTFSARFYNAGANESFQIPAITVYFRDGGDKAQQESGD